jgi:hypothetical protein
MVGYRFSIIHKVGGYIILNIILYYRPCLSRILSTHLVFASGFSFVPVFSKPTILAVVIL